MSNEKQQNDEARMTHRVRSGGSVTVGATEDHDEYMPHTEKPEHTADAKERVGGDAKPTE